MELIIFLLTTQNLAQIMHLVSFFNKPKYILIAKGIIDLINVNISFLINFCIFFNNSAIDYSLII